MEEMQMENTQAESTKIEGRNAVLEAFRSGKTIDKLFVLDGCKDGPIQTILREAKKHDTLVQFVAKERLEQLSETKKHQGVIAMGTCQIGSTDNCAQIVRIFNIIQQNDKWCFIFLSGIF